MIDSRRSRFGARQFALLQLALVCEAGQTTFPPLLGGDHARLDKEPFPFPRRTDRLALRWIAPRVLVIRVVFVVPFNMCLATGPLADNPEYFVARNRERVSGRDPAVRHLAERQILGESARGQIVDGAAQQREKRTARGVGPAGAPLEVSGNARACEGVLEQTRVVLRRSQRDRDPIEGDAAASLAEHPSCHLHALTPLAGRREHLDLVKGIGRWRSRR